MVKSIDTLISDIEDVLKFPEKYKVDLGALENEIKVEIGELIIKRLFNEREKPRLRLSEVGEHCDRKSWFKIHKSEAREILPGKTRMKFLYGDILEFLVIKLAKIAGHTVVCEQLEVIYEGITGHIDCIIDGVLVDIKSVNSRSLRKFKEHRLREDDPFGYIDQLNSYFHSIKLRDEVRVKNGFAFLCVDKELGGLLLDYYEADDEKSFSERINRKKRVCSSEVMPDRGYKIKKEPNGNEKLCMECSYCQFKKECFPGLRVFLYANKPEFLTKVVKEPLVNELI